MVAQISTRNLVDWTPDTYRQAVAAAEGGSIRLAAEFVDGLVFPDDRVIGALSARTLGLLGLPLLWEGVTPPDWLRLAPESALVSILKWGTILGFGPARILDDGTIEDWDPRHFHYDATEDRWYVQTAAGQEEVVFGQGSWLAYTPYGGPMPFLRGLWRALALPVLVKHYTLHDRARASEVFGSAMVVGTASEGTTEAQRRRWLKELEALSRNTRTVLPEGLSLDLLEAQGQTWGIYQQSIDWADSAITVAINGQVVTVQGTKGFSRGDVHERVARSLLRFTAETFSTCLAHQYVSIVWGELSYPRWAIAAPDELIGAGEGLSALARGISEVNRALRESGENARVDTRAILAQYHVPIVEVLESTETPVVKLELAPTDIARVVRVDEARRSQGLPPIGDERGSLTIGEISVAPGDAPDGLAPDLDDAATRAERLTSARATACAHGRGDACTRCGVVRAGGVWGPLIADRMIAARAAPSPDRIATPVTEFRILALGPNMTSHGPTFLTRANAAKIARVFEGREMMIDLEHLSVDPKAEGYDPDARGYCRVEYREGEGLFACDVRWTEDGTRRIREDLQRYISPVMFTNRFGVIHRMLNLALTSLPAMYYPPIVSE